MRENSVPKSLYFFKYEFMRETAAKNNFFQVTEFARKRQHKNSFTSGILSSSEELQQKNLICFTS
jgi:hypothetical protein